MGLDMWFFAEPKDPQKEEVHYWRKHNALHAWFAKRAVKDKLVENEGEFNCVDLPITEELLNELELVIRRGELVPTGGFFFGPTDYDPKDDMEEDLKAIAKAREVLADGRKCWYSSWW